ncbi:cilia- and flagella-associated protein 298-like [Corticium candelabrum]|uniref:cilia- and flagella-associated protein 298-like n=1 Tax=Corticium candelabrum TaxID=121492 RepID=UPI002E26A82A|nr:cilia- and flagella-associated protein 298-like [Corticium candelabrum]
MVILHIKKGDESQFLFKATVKTPLDELIPKLVRIYNGRLKLERICSEMESLAEHGICLPPNMQGLTDEQLDELHLVDEWKSQCIPSGGPVEKKDPMQRRNGHAPNDKMADVIKRTTSEAKEAISKRQVTSNIFVTEETIQDAMDKLRGAMMIVYPMGLPPHEPIRHEFENCEDLSETQAGLEVLEEGTAQLWWAGKECLRGKKLEDFVGRNEKTKIIAKLQKKGHGAPGREQVFSEEEQKKMMAYAYKRQEELKKLEQDEDDSHLNASWSDPTALKRTFAGVGDISWRPK